MVKLVFNCFLMIAVTVNACEQNWKSFENHCYVMVERLESWHAAMEYCKAFSAALVTIDDPEEFRFLQDTLRAQYRTNDSSQPIIEYWTAGNDIIVEGRWVWAPSSEEMEYKPWAPGEPNQSLNGIDDCAGLFNWQDFRMNDDNCDEPRYFLCENENKPNGPVVG